MKRIVLTVCGFLALAIGAVGAVIPVLPTTSFVLLAAICFSVSNKRLSGWLKQSPLFGPYIENYRTKQGISLGLKIGSMAFLWAGLNFNGQNRDIVGIYPAGCCWGYGPFVED